MEVKLVLEEKPEPEQPTIWHAISAGLAVGFLGLVILAIPWSGFYKTQLNWHDSQGIAAFLAALSAYNCLSLLVRIQIIENAGTRWNDISDFHVAVAASALANILFWSGMAMWFVAADLNLSRFFCFITTALGAGGHV
ncbi:MAG: hypothetical protein K8F91_26770, partial [Candidatus Obscuribacterales bacterium]|nr:hypothetical protein [Candidatus Obscuribacterales bacterium]